MPTGVSSSAGSVPFVRATSTERPKRPPGRRNAARIWPFCAHVAIAVPSSAIVSCAGPEPFGRACAAPKRPEAAPMRRNTRRSLSRR